MFYHIKAVQGSAHGKSTPTRSNPRALRILHFSIRTEATYIQWIKRFILFHGKRHPAEMAEREVTTFLTDLAVNRYVAASTQNQALATLLFLYHMVLETDLPWLEDVVRTKRLLACAHAPISWFAAVMHDCQDEDVVVFN